MDNLKRIRYSIDNILQMLREKEIFNLKDVQVGIIEANGYLSVLKQDSKALVTLADMNLSKKGHFPIVPSNR